MMAPRHLQGRQLGREGGVLALLGGGLAAAEHVGHHAPEPIHRRGDGKVIQTPLRIFCMENHARNMISGV
jgi:hypothetical protein